MNTLNENDFFGPVISSYSREQAIKDGVLIDMRDEAKEAGFKFPVAFTCGLYSLIERACIKGKNDSIGVSWDILYMAIKAIKKQLPGVEYLDESTFLYSVIITGLGAKRYQKLKCVCGPGDNLEPVITIMLPGED